MAKKCREIRVGTYVFVRQKENHLKDDAAGQIVVELDRNERRSQLSVHRFQRGVYLSTSARCFAIVIAGAARRRVDRRVVHVLLLAHNPDKPTTTIKQHKQTKI